jgi:hypothetical protein
VHLLVLISYLIAQRMVMAHLKYKYLSVLVWLQQSYDSIMLNKEFQAELLNPTSILHLCSIQVIQVYIQTMKYN